MYSPITPRLINWTPPNKLTMTYVLAQPATELLENLAQSTQMIRAKLKKDVNTPIAVIIRIGLIDQLVIPSTANPSILLSG